MNLVDAALEHAERCFGRLRPLAEKRKCERSQSRCCLRFTVLQLPLMIIAC